MNADDNTYWRLAYLHGIETEVTLGEDGWPQCRLDAAMALVNLGAHVRRLTADESTLQDGLLRALTFRADELVAMLLVPSADLEADRAIVERYRSALAEATEHWT